jgi:aryl-alcohol dehydrogenase-like predicted oxidoreductase
MVGSGGPPVGAVGLGCMSMSPGYGSPDEREAVATIRRALDLGVTHLDTADSYGAGAGEEIVGRAIRGRRTEAFLATKVGFVRDEDGGFGVDARPERIRAALEGSLRRLGVDYVDLYYLHRVDSGVPVEESIGAIADLVREGKAARLGISETSAATIRRAHAVHPVSALQSEWSLVSRDVEADVVPTCRELGIALVPFSPLGRGLIAGAVRALDALATDDLRRIFPRFQGENLDRNVVLVERLAALARDRGATPGQLALAWLLHQGPDVLPIPGTARAAHLEENAAAAEIALTPGEVRLIEEALPATAVAGSRYPPELERLVGR